MKNQITSREYELLSAYLDNQLGSKERAHLESRLKADTELRKELHEIEKTRLLLRSLPKLRAPRNYYLSAEVAKKPAGVHPSLRLAPAYGIVSAIATILLVLVIFGDRLITSTAPVALAPAAVAPNESVVVQPEVQRSEASPSSPTEAVPMVMSGAPVLASPLPTTAASKVGESEVATPTTIYLDAYPPTSTSEISMSIMNVQTMTATISCEEYTESGAYPTLPYTCPTPTGVSSEYLQSSLPTSTLTYSATPTPTSNTIPAQIFPPSPTPSFTSAPTEIPLSIQSAAPESGVEAPSPVVPSDQVMDAGNPTPSGVEPAETPGTTPNFGFIQYLLLAFEISLAAIAIIAGIIAIILLIRAGR
jgi:hypothetical protein